ncbi:MAG: response regulator [Myxococcales bacterium]|nr:response regulator [Myxococcales bacterium]MCB9520505.1 response regulator [Myxococcales bacterium]
MPDRPTILIAEDDEADVLLLRAAAQRAGLKSELRFVHDGIELLDYLLHEGPYEGTTGDKNPRPYLVLLDINLPRLDGRSALAEMRLSAETRYLPVVVMSTASHPEEVRRSLDAGANAVVVKPVEMTRFVETMRAIEDHWLNTAAPAPR